MCPAGTGVKLTWRALIQAKGVLLLISPKSAPARFRKPKLLPESSKDDLRDRSRLFDVIAVYDKIKFIG